MTTTIEPVATQAKDSRTTVGGKHLTFCLVPEYNGSASHNYGIAVHKIREIIRNLEVTPVPQVPSHVHGVINLRGRIIPVIDLRRRLNVGRTENNNRTCIVVVEIEIPGDHPTKMGMVVDVVEEVVNIREEEIEEAPSFGSGCRLDYVLGMAKVKGKVITLLDIDRVITSEEITELGRPTDQQPR